MGRQCSLFPQFQETPSTERFCVVSATPEFTILRSCQFPLMHWRLFTTRMPASWPAGKEVTVTFTPMEWQWLQGKRDLEALILEPV